jgi:glucokinase
MDDLAMPEVVGIDIGGTNVRVGVFSGLTLVQETRFHANFMQVCKDHSPQQAWQMILDTVKQGMAPVLKAFPTVSTVGVGFPGFIDPHTAIIAQSPNLPGLHNIPLQQDLTAVLGKKVLVMNDANAAAYGEYCLARQPAEGLIYIGLGTGVGGGLVIHGRPFAGQHGCAMEVGHMCVEQEGRVCGCGNRGCLEQYASATGVSISYFNATQLALSSAEIAQKAQQGDSHALAAFALAGQALAQTLANILKVVDVPNVVIGGGMASAWPLMLAPFDQRLQQDLIPVLRGKVSVRISQSHDMAGMLGAATLAAS